MLNRLLAVGDGRGFVVASHYRRFVITAAHCLPHLPEGFSIGFEEERTYPKLLGPIGNEPTVAAACVFVDPVTDVAVLSASDDQAMPDEACAFEELVDSIEPFRVAEPFNPALLISLERHLLAFEHAAARLINHPHTETAIMRDLVADGVDRQGGRQVLAAHRGECCFCTGHHVLGNGDQRTVDRGLALLTLPRRHPLNLAPVTEAVMMAYGFFTATLAGMTCEGLITAVVDTVHAGRRTVKIRRLQITDARWCRLTDNLMAPGI